MSASAKFSRDIQAACLCAFFFLIGAGSPVTCIRSQTFLEVVCCVIFIALITAGRSESIEFPRSSSLAVDCRVDEACPGALAVSFSIFIPRLWIVSARGTREKNGQESRARTIHAFASVIGRPGPALRTDSCLTHFCSACAEKRRNKQQTRVPNVSDLVLESIHRPLFSRTYCPCTIKTEELLFGNDSKLFATG